MTVNGVFLCIGLVFLLYFLYVIISQPVECPDCGHYSVNHSHTEMIGSTDIEVYECENCKSQFV